MILASLLDKKIFSALKENLPKLKDKTWVIVGIELRVFKESLDVLHKLFKPNVFVYYNPKGFFFHPKLHIIKLSEKEGVIVVGSSNLTLAGFFENLEINLALELDLEIPVEKEIFDDAVVAFKKILCLKSINPLNEELIEKIGQVRMPRKRPLQGKRPIPRLSDLFESDEIDFEGYTNFVMTLSYNDVSGKRSEKYIRIPKHAVEKNTAFWGWDNKFSPSAVAGFPERRIKIIYDKKPYTYRMYYVPRVSEMRLVFPKIYKLGKAYVGSILCVTKTNGEYKAKLVKKDGRGYKKLLGYCTEISPKGQSAVPKRWGYFYS